MRLRRSKRSRTRTGFLCPFGRAGVATVSSPLEQYIASRVSMPFRAGLGCDAVGDEMAGAPAVVSMPFRAGLGCDDTCRHDS